MGPWVSLAHPPAVFFCLRFRSRPRFPQNVGPDPSLLKIIGGREEGVLLLPISSFECTLSVEGQGPSVMYNRRGVFGGLARPRVGGFFVEPSRLQSSSFPFKKTTPPGVTL